MVRLRQREPRFESRRLLDLAHGVDYCTNCDTFTGGCEPAHEDALEGGKATGTKAHDNRHAALCHDCHVWYDSGRAGRDPSGIWSSGQRQFMWERAHKRTFDIYWRRGLLRVT
jgi:hypothetical protein